MGNLIRQASPETIKWMTKIDSDEKETIRQMIRKGIRSHELSILLSKGKSIEEIQEAAVSNTGLIPELLDFGNSSNASDDFSQSNFDEIKLLHEKWRTPLLFHHIKPKTTQLIQENDQKNLQNQNYSKYLSKNILLIC